MPLPAHLKLFDGSLGIQSVMDSQGGHPLPDARPLSPNVLHAAGLEKLYSARNMRAHVEALLCPHIGDGDIVRPEIFTARLREATATLEKSSRPEAVALVEGELKELMKNTELLQAYTGLMLGG